MQLFLAGEDEDRFSLLSRVLLFQHTEESEDEAFPEPAPSGEATSEASEMRRSVVSTAAFPGFFKRQIQRESLPEWQNLAGQLPDIALQAVPTQAMTINAQPFVPTALQASR